MSEIHIHVGSNIPGYLPESDITCFDNVTDALEALRHELKDQQEHYYEGCQGHCPDCAEYEVCGGSEHGESCEWCDVASDVEAALSAIADGDAAYHMRNGQGCLHVFSPPEGANMAHWAMFTDGDRDACEIAQEQDA